MCHPKGKVSGPTRIYTSPILVSNRVWFPKVRKRMNLMLSIRFQMNKNEIEICEFEMHLKNYFLCALIQEMMT